MQQWNVGGKRNNDKSIKLNQYRCNLSRFQRQNEILQFGSQTNESGNATEPVEWSLYHQVVQTTSVKESQVISGGQREPPKMEPSRSSGHLTVNFFYIKRNAYFGSSRYEESPFSEFPLPVIIISSFSFSFPSLASIYFISLFNIRSITKRTKKASRNLLKNLQFEEETSKFGQMIFFRGAVTGQSVETEAVKREEKNVIME